MKFLLTERAEQDLSGIVDYTIDTWGYQQALVYNQHFDDAFQAIAENPHLPLSKNRQDLMPNLRALKVEKHFVFYTISETEITVVRILHEAMDFPRHFLWYKG